MPSAFSTGALATKVTQVRGDEKRTASTQALLVIGTHIATLLDVRDRFSEPSIAWGSVIEHAQTGGTVPS